MKYNFITILFFCVIMVYGDFDEFGYQKKSILNEFR